MEDIKALVRSLAEGVDLMIVNKETLAALQAAGLKTVEPPQLSVEEYLDVLFSRRKQKAVELATMLPAPPVIEHPSIGSLYNEIRECILFGLFGPAITLCGVLVEYALKYAAITREAGSGKYDAAKWDEFEKMTLAPAIERALAAGLITAQEEKDLKEFKEDIRNPYNHYNTKKITQNVIAKGVKKLDIRTGEVDIVDIAAKDDVVIMAQAKPFVDSKMVFIVFGFANEMVARLLERIAGS